MTDRKKALFWLASAMIVTGALMHLPDFVATRGDHFIMAGMPMSSLMKSGMVLVLIGTLVAGWSVIPARSVIDRKKQVDELAYRAIDGAALGSAHWRLLSILMVGLVIDTMKPASLGFAVPGMADEYGLGRGVVALFPFCAITGTVVGSLLWGYLADLIGRRATLLFSGAIYMATSVCGFMPTFEWNLLMCFVMGAAAGGMLPTVYSLTAESVPARRRGTLVVLQSGLGATLGYLVASGAAAVLVPLVGWRIIWLLNLPTGALLLVLCRWIPESPRFLLALGRDADALRIMERYGMRLAATSTSISAGDSAGTGMAESAVSVIGTEGEPGGVHATMRGDQTSTGPPAVAAVPGPPRSGSRPSMGSLFALSYRQRTVSMMLYGLGWGVVNWGFITFLPTLLGTGGSSGAVNNLLFLSALFGIPNTVVAAYLYGRWSSRGAMMLYAALTVLVLLGFGVGDPAGHGFGVTLFLLLAVLLASTGGMIAMLSPYSTELFPTSLRATGSGLAAAASKVGGMLGPLLVTSTPRVGLAAVVTAVPVLVAIGALFLTGVETAGRPLVESKLF